MFGVKYGIPLLYLFSMTNSALDEVYEMRLIEFVNERSHLHVLSEWWRFETVVIVLILKYLYEPKAAVS